MDGLTDNIFPSEMITTLCSYAAQAGETEDEQVQNMADDMVDYVQQCMEDMKKVTPIQCAFLRLLCFIVRCTLAIDLQSG